MKMDYIKLINDPIEYTQTASGIRLRPWQREPIARILDSIQKTLGDTIIIVFPRQSGKDELLIHLIVYLMDMFSHLPVGIVEANPTYNLQTTNVIQRFERALNRNKLTCSRWTKRGQFMRMLDQAKVTFLSGDRASNVVGATASLLLIVNEAQDIQPADYYKKFVPMTASTNATRVLAGTVWSSSSLLAEEMRVARQMQEIDGRQRLFMADANVVRAFLPKYGEHVDAEIARNGRDHPLIKTQYFNEEIDAQSVVFTPLRLALIQGDRPAQDEPLEHGMYAFTIDVGGQDEAVMSDPYAAPSNPGRDHTTLSIIEVDNSSVEELEFPTYRVVKRLSWTGESQLTIFAQLKSLAHTWYPQQFVIDATGVGEGLWAMLNGAFPEKVTPVHYTAQVKSKIYYDFLAMINTGRFKDCASAPEVELQYQELPGGSA